jgi:hypothetical protein
MTEGSKHTTGFAFYILQASLGGANPVFFLLESAKHLPKSVWPLGACGVVRFLRTEALESAGHPRGPRDATGGIVRNCYIFFSFGSPLPGRGWVIAGYSTQQTF